MIDRNIVKPCINEEYARKMPSLLMKTWRPGKHRAVQFSFLEEMLDEYIKEKVDTKTLNYQVGCHPFRVVKVLEIMIELVIWPWTTKF